ncbi:hypothetical protein K0M31_019361 [Melipona bicolor]|uniref:Uncharacterized protein n=1 Tax=Melipona bicolor TaxID=60889 RepID=A0AA40G292_9HYME|nr:hypothetical protein K0M31_019361 [Melipona bicolor]
MGDLAMNGLDAIFWCSCVVAVFQTLARAEDVASKSNDSLRIDVTRGIALYVGDDEASVTLSLSSLFERNGVEQRSGRKLKFDKDTLKRIGMAMMMAPVMWQLAGLPGALASIKLNLIRSIIVGKIALAVMLFNALRNSQKSEVVLVHKPEYHEHYHTYHKPEDDYEGW